MRSLCVSAIFRGRFQLSRSRCPHVLCHEDTHGMPLVVKSALRRDRSAKSVNRCHQPVFQFLPVRQKIANGFCSSGLKRAEPAALLRETLLPSSEEKKRREGKKGEKGTEKRNNVVSRCSPSPRRTSPLSAGARPALSRNASLRQDSRREKGKLAEERNYPSLSARRNHQRSPTGRGREGLFRRTFAA